MSEFLKVKRLGLDAIIPKRANVGDAGYDLYSPIDITIPAHEQVTIPLNISISVPTTTYGRVAPRSGLAHKHSLDVMAGVIDSSYRGEVGVILINHGSLPVQIQKGNKVAQLILEKIETPDVVEVDELDNTERGSGGFGSTGA